MSLLPDGAATILNGGLVELRVHGKEGSKQRVRQDRSCTVTAVACEGPVYRYFTVIGGFCGAIRDCVMLGGPEPVRS